MKTSDTTAIRSQCNPTIIYWNIDQYGPFTMTLDNSKSVKACLQSKCVEHIPISDVNIQQYNLVVLVDHYTDNQRINREKLQQLYNKLEQLKYVINHKK